MAKRENEHTPLPVPNGWFAVEFSRDLHEGDVKPIFYCGEELVLFRTRSGKARILDAFCPHLGAHLGHGGRVMGESVRCPFHAWQLDGETGRCTNVPYSDQIPNGAGVRAWDVQEKNGLIWIWHHATGAPPEWDFPALPEFDDEEWTEPRNFEAIFEAHVQDTHENNNDNVHFHFVHTASEIPDQEVVYTPNSTHYRITSYSTRETALGTFRIATERDSWGLGLNAIYNSGIPGAGLLLYAATTPIDEHRVHSRWQLTATRNLVDIAGEEFMKAVTTGVEEDLDIWKYKVHRARPMLTKEDRFVADFRRWARQFYCEPTADEETP